jgi:large subunit ribosomal protein L3
MAKIKQPRSGSLQYRPRRRAKSEVARVRSWALAKEAKLLGFAGYKVGMTHVSILDTRSSSMTKNEEIVLPVTIVECPPLKAFSAIFYKNTPYGIKKVSQVIADKPDKDLARSFSSPKKIKKKLDSIKLESYDYLRLLVHTLPRMTTIGKKKPELFEIAIGGKKEDQLNFAKEKFGKEIKVDEVLAAGMQINTHSITIGKGCQGPVKRDGISLKSHKSEKSRRRAVLGAEGTAKVLFSAHQGGKMGYHPRTEYNKWLLKISEDNKGITPKSGFKRYGIVKNQYILIKGSVGGPAKRLIRISYATRPSRKFEAKAPNVQFVRVK